MLELNNVTLCCVDCVNYSAATNAINHSVNLVKFKEALFITDRDIKYDTFKTIEIAKINSKEEYSWFMLNSLNDYILTDFVLIIQYDGYVLRPDLWNDEFLNYDYIGAPWLWHSSYRVGNGGFSLRSKTLLAATQLEYFEKFHPEDDIICRENRELLEKKYNIKFAPEKLAKQFSFEPSSKDAKFKNDSFGFHGIANFIKR
jgi:hypothetical protein